MLKYVTLSRIHALVFARGILEAAPIGSIVGPPFKAALQSCHYGADIAGFEAGGDTIGSKNLAADVTAQASACPNTKIVMSGYSQGAQLVHNSSALLSAAALPEVLNSHSLTICATGDIICLGGQIITAAHLGYGANAAQAASFVVARI
ncbi:carbohydrate esterase family 5 protein [Sphaerobolus stellatus SS14]|uniref:Cutinase n=1 Tax=Sphaerobolus stellatus (strain SS14) TaxID=990650 RepID=A0A0C9VGG2_SPHS4|nr:carbohydrate esterase family 5 protein [Sphaerobolus stellatus SS14]